MAARKSGLGRGLDALLPADRPDHGFGSVPLDAIRPNPNQPRRRFADDTLESLAASIKEVGVLQPVVVDRSEPDGYVLVVGERRWRAARLAGLAEIPAVIRESAEDSRGLVQALIENVQREDLRPLEEAAGYRQLLEDFGLTHEEVAKRIGKSRSTVSNMLRLLQLPAQVQGLLDRGEITNGHARALVGVEDAAYAVHIAERAAAEGWSVRQVETAVRARSGDAPARRSKTADVRPAAIIELENRLADRLGARVTIAPAKRGGKIVVRYRKVDDLERIYRTLFGE